MKKKENIEVITMPNDYIMFVFYNVDDHDDILRLPWFYGKRGLLFNKWQPRFNPSKAKVMNASIYVTLPHLPFEFWHNKVLEGIIISFEKFITTNKVTKA